MPLYEYYCKSCNWSFETLRSISESDKDATCPECGTTARKKLSVVARIGAGSMEMGGLPMYGESAGGGCACGGACSC